MGIASKPIQTIFAARDISAPPRYVSGKEGDAMISVFFSYSHADEGLRDQLEEQLAILKRQGVISTWHDRRITAGSDLDHAISGNLEAADIILLLVSPPFLNSDYCYDREMTRAMERHAAGEAVVIPVTSDW